MDVTKKYLMQILGSVFDQFFQQSLFKKGQPLESRSTQQTNRLMLKSEHVCLNYYFVDFCILKLIYSGRHLGTPGLHFCYCELLNKR